MSVGGTTTLNDLFLNTSESLLTELYSSRVFNNTDFLSDSATISIWRLANNCLYAIRYYLDLNVRAEIYLKLTISDRSNRVVFMLLMDSL